MTKKLRLPAIPRINRKRQPITDNKTFHLLLAGLHAAQAIAILYLSRAVFEPVTTNYVTGNDITKRFDSALNHLFDINLSWLVAAMFLVPAVAHLLMATSWNARYENELGRGLNRLRWVESALAGPLMIAIIALLAGIRDISTLILVMALTSLAGLLNLVGETDYVRNKQKHGKLLFVVSVIAGTLPWLAIAGYLVANRMLAGGKLPDYVIGIAVSVFVLFVGLALITLFRYQKRGKWADYPYVDRAYWLIGLVAKAVLAWQVYANLLRK